MKFNEILKELRIERNITHEKLSKEIGWSKAVIGSWERGSSQPTAGAIIALANFFNVSTDYLLGLEDDSGAKYNINGNAGHVFIKSNNNSLGAVGITNEELKTIKKIIDKAVNDKN